MAPFRCPPPGCYPPVAENWKLTNDWTGRSTVVTSRLQPPQWPQQVWESAMLHTGVPQYALDEFHRRSRSERRSICDRGKSRSRSRSKGRYREIDRVHEGEYRVHVPSKQDFSFESLKKKPSKKQLKSILKHKDSRLFFDTVKGPYYGFNTFSDHSIMYDGFKFPTAEHLLLYFKFEEWPDISHYLRQQPTVARLWEEARQFSDKKSVSWKHNQLHFMELTLWYKFTQHKSLKKMLLGTGERSITFVSHVDSFWGAREDGHGKNYLGKALEKTRRMIRTCTPPA